MATENTRIALSRLDELIRDPQSRQQFLEHPRETLQDTGSDPDDVPEAVWEALIRMSAEELTAIAALGAALDGAGLFDGSLAWQFVV
jgi:hypothetical protein